METGSASCLDGLKTGLQWSRASAGSSADTSPCRIGSRLHRGTPTLFRAYPGSQPTAQCSWPCQISAKQLHFFLFQCFCSCFGDTWKRASPNGKDKSPRPASCGCTFSAIRVTESLSSGMRFGQWHLRLMQLIQPYPREVDEVRKLGKDLFAVGRMVKLTHQIELTAAVGEEKVGKWSPAYCFF